MRDPRVLVDTRPTDPERDRSDERLFVVRLHRVGGGPGHLEWCDGPVRFYGWEDSHSMVEFLDCVGEVGDGVDAFEHLRALLALAAAQPVR